MQRLVGLGRAGPEENGCILEDDLHLIATVGVPVDILEDKSS